MSPRVPLHLAPRLSDAVVGVLHGKPLTVEEKLARLEQRVASRFGEAGAELVREVTR